MFTSTITLVALSALTLVSAQADSNSTFKIGDPETVEISDRVSWCTGQQDSCSTLCGSVITNACEISDLNFECVCQGGESPDMNEYQNTMNWFVCHRLQDNCITANENNANGQKNCTDTFGDNCGTEAVADHKGEGASSGTTTTSATSSGTAAPESTGEATSSTATGGAMPTAHVQHLGNGAAAVAIGLLAYAL